MKRYLLFLLFAATASAADFGDIPANLTLGAGTSVRRNAGNTAFEAFTPGGSGTVTSFSSGDLSPLFTTSVGNPTTTPALTFSLSSASAHTFFANNTGGSTTPSFTSFVAGTDYWDTTVFTGGTDIGLVPPANGVPSCLRFLDENGVWSCASGSTTGAAPDDAHYLTSQSESSLSNEVNLGALTTGLLKASISGSVATMSTITDSSSNWDTAYTDRLKWDGGATGLTAATGRASLGGTTVGQNIFTLTNPSAVTWIRMNADNTVTARTAAQTLSDIGASAVTPAALTKSDDTNVTLTLGGTPTTALLQATSLTLGWAGTLAVSRGGTGAGTLTGLVLGNGTSAMTAVTAPSGAVVGTTDTQTLTNKWVKPRSTATPAPGATPAVNTDSFDVVSFTSLGTAITSMSTSLSGTPVTGQRLLLGFKDDGTARGITWGASFQSGPATLLATTVISKQHWVGLIYDGTKWTCFASDATGY